MSIQAAPYQQESCHDGSSAVTASPVSMRPYWGRLLLAGAIVTTVLAAIPGRTSIPPLVESDYSYLLTAADRFVAGDGLTTTPPVAPFQPWDWTADWTFLTKWPIGYPLLVVCVRWLTGGSTLEACGWINVWASALALVGWFAWTRRCIPGGLTSILVAAVAAGCAVSTSLLLNPSTDLLIVAALPYVLLVTADAIAVQQSSDSPHARGRGWTRFLMGGVLAGSLFWFRYASIFVPVAVLIYLLLLSRARVRRIARQVVPFAIGSIVPIVSLLIINRINAPTGSFQEQLNLGTTVSWDLPLSLVGAAWWRFTDLGFYDYHAVVHWMFACWPGLLLMVAVLYKPSRLSLWTSLKLPGNRWFPESD